MRGPLVALLAIGCAPLDTDAFAERAAAAACRAEEACDAAGYTAAYADDSDCHTATLDWIDALAAMNQQLGCTYDAAAGKRCLAAIRDADCSDDDDVWPDVCSAVYVC